MRIATVGCGIYFGQDHPLNTAAIVEGRNLDSYRAELQAVRLTLSGCRKWETKLWITLDSSAVVGDLNKRIQNQGKMHKKDNQYIWESLNLLIAERAKRKALRVTWTKGHATEEHIAEGKTSKEEKARNEEADELATKGKAMNEVNGTMVKAARQRKTITALQQTKLVKMWMNRQDLAACDQAEQQQLDDEAEAIAEMQAAFSVKESTSQRPETSTEDTTKEEGGRRSWQYVKIKIPTYQWETEEGKNSKKLKKDTMPNDLKEEQQSWWYKGPKGEKNRIIIDFPLHLWGEVGQWWERLEWSDRNPGLLKGVTWLELVADFEIATGVNCIRQHSNTTWGARAELLRGIVKLILKVRGTGAAEMETYYGTSKRITALAPFGAQFLGGL